MILKPAFTENNIAITCSSDDNYVPYLMVLICSIVSNISNTNNYDIVILEEQISNEKKEIIKQQERRNVSIRFFNMSEYIGDKEMLWSIPNKNWTKATYYRMLVPYIFLKFKKVIYLDCDVINLYDIGEMYNIDIEDYLIGAVRLCGCFVVSKSNMLNATYVYNHYFLPEVNLENYFNAGVLLINVERFRKIFSKDYILKFVSAQSYDIVDQDCLNVLCANQVKYIDAAWNWYPYTPQEFSNVMKLCPEENKRYYMEGNIHPKNIHFTIPVKPWLEPYGTYSYVSSLFWEYACQSCFFDEMLKKLQKYQENKITTITLVKRTWNELHKYAKNRKLFLYGLGNRGKEFLELYKDKFPVKGIIDRDENKKEICGSIQFIELKNIDYIDTKDIGIVVSNDDYEDIIKDLRYRGFTNLFSYKCLIKRDIIAWYPDLNDFRKVEYASSILYDRRSKEIYWNIIQKREQFLYDRNTKYLDFYEGETYFRNDFFHISNDEIYIDLGSYKGFTIEKFKEYVHGKYKKIFSYEADYIEERLDDFLQEEKVTFIKMDVRNTMDVLTGAEGIIKRCRPKLAVCVSRNYADLWEVPIFLKRVVPDYNLHIRHHSPDVSLSVVYAAC